MNITQRIIELRKQTGLSQEEFGEKLGLSRQSISKWETGEAIPDVDNLILLSQKYDISIDYLLLGKEHSSIHDNSQEKSKKKKKNGTDYEALLWFLTVSAVGAMWYFLTNIWT